MSLSGLKKQINKANQFLSENIAGVKGTQLDPDYVELEKKIDTLDRLCRDLDEKTLEYLQPNPTTRAKLSATQTFARIRGAAQTAPYPQPEGELGNAMYRSGRELGPDSLFGAALLDAGEAHKQLAEHKYALEENVKMNYIAALRTLSNKELKEIAFHRKKTEGRRLDYDCKKRYFDRGVKDVPGSGKIDDNELRFAAEKFEESKLLAEMAMFNVIDNETEHIAQLTAFVQAELDYHRQSAALLDRLVTTLRDKLQSAAARPKREYAPKRVLLPGQSPSSGYGVSGSNLSVNTSLNPSMQSISGYSPGANSQSSSANSSANASGGFGGLFNAGFSALKIGGSESQANGTPNGNGTGTGNGNGNGNGNGTGFGFGFGGTTGNTNGSSPAPTRAPAPVPAPAPNAREACARVLYDFAAENAGELDLKEGEMVKLLQQVDENWFEGEVNGRRGFFPVNYVEIVVPITK